MVIFHEYLEKIEITVLVGHIGKFSKSGIPIYNSEVPDKASRKTKRRKKSRTQAITKRYTFHANATRQL